MASAKNIALLERQAKEAKSNKERAEIYKKIKEMKATLTTEQKTETLPEQRRKVKVLKTEDFQAFINELKKRSEYSFLKGMSDKTIKDDYRVVGKPVGWRIKGKGNNKVPSAKFRKENPSKVYFENRRNRSDVERPNRLEQGGIVDFNDRNFRKGKTIYNVIWDDKKNVQRKDFLDKKEATAFYNEIVTKPSTFVAQFSADTFNEYGHLKDHRSLGLYPKMADRLEDGGMMAKGGKAPEWLFQGTYPNAYVYSDKRDQSSGDYHRIGMITFNPLRLKISDNSPKYAKVIEGMRKEYESLKNEKYVQVSATGQTAAIKYNKMADGGSLKKKDEAVMPDAARLSKSYGTIYVVKRADGEEVTVTEDELSDELNYSKGKVVAKYVNGIKQAAEGGMMGDDENAFSKQISSAKDAASRSYDWNKALREYVGSDYHKLSEREKDEILAEMQARGYGRTNFKHGGSVGLRKGQSYTWMDRGGEHTIYVSDIEEDTVYFRQDGRNKTLTKTAFIEMIGKAGAKPDFMKKGGAITDASGLIGRMTAFYIMGVEEPELLQIEKAKFSDPKFDEKSLHLEWTQGTYSIIRGEAKIRKFLDGESVTLMDSTGEPYKLKLLTDKFADGGTTEGFKPDVQIVEGSTDAKSDKTGNWLFPADAGKKTVGVRLAKGGEIEVGDWVAEKRGIARGKVYEDKGVFVKLEDKYGNKSNTMYFKESLKHSSRPRYAEGGRVNMMTGDETYRISGPANSIEKDILEKVNYEYLRPYFVGAFSWRTSDNKLAEGYLFDLDDFDKTLVGHFKLKENERIFRYFNRTSAIGGIVPFIKINLDKALLYFIVGKEFGDDHLEFETKGVKAEYITLNADKLKDSFAKGGMTKKEYIAKKVGKVMHEFKVGTLRSGSGAKVTKRDQAIAIGLSEGREGWKHKSGKKYADGGTTSDEKYLHLFGIWNRDNKGKTPNYVVTLEAPYISPAEAMKRIGYSWFRDASYQYKMRSETTQDYKNFMKARKSGLNDRDAAQKAKIIFTR